MAVAFGRDEFLREVKLVMEVTGVRRGCTRSSAEKTEFNSIKKYLLCSYLVAGTVLGMGNTNTSNSQYLNLRSSLGSAEAGPEQLQ